MQPSAAAAAAAGIGTAPVAGTGAAGWSAGHSGSLGSAAAGGDAVAASGAAGAPSGDAGMGASGNLADVAGEAGSAGAGGIAGAPAVGDSDPTFSDSFEDAPLDTARYEIVMPDCSGTGMVDIDSQTAHGGMRSLRVQGGGGYCDHVFVRPKSLDAALPQPLYVRVFVKLASPLGAGHVTFAAMHDAHSDKDLRLGGQNEVLIWNRESDDATLPELSPTGTGLSTPLKAETWHCLEWEIDASGPTMRTWLDGVPVEGLTLDADPTPDVDRQWQNGADFHPELADLRLGWESYSGQTNTLWFDDLAVGASRIACGP